MLSILDQRIALNSKVNVEIDAKIASQLYINSVVQNMNGI